MITKQMTTLLYLFLELHPLVCSISVSQDLQNISDLPLLYD